MKWIDMNKLETAIIYVQRIADGNNPVNNVPVEADSVLNNPHVIRCMYFVKEVLEEVKCHGGYTGSKLKKADKQAFPMAALADFAYREDLAISRFVKQINEFVDDRIYQKLSYKPITQWLKSHGFLTEVFNQEFQKNVTMPTEKGRRIGIRAERMVNLKGTDYMYVVYNKQAQEYIVQNMEAILHSEDAETSNAPERAN
ncbi:hypothetical protein [Fibrobacter intestinalis]|uniref:hypothetical protein n=1 Tax=Fibrobacter intestinalis TaxID=28122 RepID=UPI0023F3B3F7|nr:hypothetical protein [Fibrobacter intestinalis]MDD7298165.1 hypothetical protein [Fibrobacter intestinalis]